ncbi:hypothetical protein ABGB16_26070 [Micromonospora sp. B11E3]|uniref:hypothetical protein n=1 Tax=Micromonospora sp. B11E3 TaxID=3153562 RepID=UPI00325D2319
MKKRVALMVALLVAMSACTSLTGGKTYRVDAVWLAGNQVYVVHDEEAGKEVWRRDGAKEVFVARGTDIPDACGPVDFLFDAGSSQLGIGLECSDGERLVAYTPGTGDYRTLFDVPSAGEVTIQPGGQGGYLSTGLNGCWALATFGQTPPGILSPAARFTCEQGGSAKAPHLLPNGDLLFIGTDAKPTQQPVRNEDRAWCVYLLTPGASVVRPVGPDLVGFPEMNVTPDGRTAIVSVWRKGSGSLVAVDLATGDHRRLADSDDSVTSPAVSPQGDEVMYVDDLSKVETVRLAK